MTLVVKIIGSASKRRNCAPSDDDGDNDDDNDDNDDDDDDGVDDDTSSSDEDAPLTSLAPFQRAQTHIAAATAEEPTDILMSNRR